MPQSTAAPHALDSQHSVAAGAPISTPRDVLVSADNIPFSAIMDLRQALREAKGAAEDGRVTLSAAVAEGLHAVLVDHAKLRETKRSLQGDKKVRFHMDNKLKFEFTMYCKVLQCTGVREDTAAQYCKSAI